MADNPNQLDERDVSGDDAITSGSPHGVEPPSSEGKASGSPEPPSNWKPEEGFSPYGDIGDDGSEQRRGGSLPGVAFIGRTPITLNEREAAEFDLARKLVSASQIAALVSLFIGGVLLSTLAIVLAMMGYRKLSAIADGRSGKPEESRALKRSGMLAIAMGALALVVNAVALAVLYPAVIQAAQQGDFSGLFASSKPGTSISSPSTGTSLFG